MKITTKSHVTHVNLTCSCGKSWDDYNTGKQNATAHVRKTGHTVTGDIGYAFTIAKDKFS